jgi:hypothetical protein
VPFYFQIFLAAVVGFIPAEMVRAIREFIDFSYLVRREVIDADVLDAIDGCVERYHAYRESFKSEGVLSKTGFNLPRQHSMVHYRRLIQQFGAPNGLSTSLVESKHKESVKEPWRRSNRNDAVLQMAKTVERMEKLKAARAEYEKCGMLTPVAKRSAKRSRSHPSESGARRVRRREDLNSGKDGGEADESTAEEDEEEQDQDNIDDVRREDEGQTRRMGGRRNTGEPCAHNRTQDESSTARLPKTAGK